MSASAQATAPPTFSAPAAIPVGVNPRAVAVGDFNGDGKQDLAAANFGGNNVTFLLGNGSGGFAPASFSPISTGGAPDAIVGGDFNGDGRPDLAVANSGSATVSIYINTSSGFNGITQNVTVGTTPVAIAAADFNHDGALDLAIANQGSNNVSILLNNGAGTFSNASASPIALTSGGQPQSPTAIVASDFNHDGVPDLALPTSGTMCPVCLSVLTGNGDGTFATGGTAAFAGATPQSSIVAGDLNGDGARDLAVSNESCYIPDTFLGFGNAQFLEPGGAISCSGSGPTLLALADFDDDGASELAAANNGTNAVQLMSVAFQGVQFPSMTQGSANGSATFTNLGPAMPVGSLPSGIAVGDFNGDGKPDLVTVNGGSNDVAVLLNTSQPAAAASPSSLSFVPAPVGSLSGSRAVSVTNTGAAPLSVSAVSLVGQDANAFKISGDGCSGETLAAGASCTVGLQFAPVAAGPLQAVLRVSSNAPAGALLVGLSGAGLPSGVSGLVFANMPDPAFGTGLNTNGQLGNGATVNLSSPTGLAAGSFVALAAGGSHSLGLRADGTVWAWGANNFGQLGNGSNVDAHSPVQVPTPAGMVGVAAGSGHSLAVRSDGTVWAWGENNLGQLGNGTTANSNVPVAVSGLSNVVAVSAGVGFSLALRSDGTVWAWGANAQGQLGIGSVTSSLVPVQVHTISGVVEIAAGGYHALALKGDGTVWAWGYGAYGQVGNGSSANSLVPVQATGAAGATAIAAGQYHSLAIIAGGVVKAWGYNSNGQLGNNSTTNSSSPLTVPGISAAVQIAAGALDSLAIKADGTAAAWGAGFQGQLGAGSPPQDSHTPTFVLAGNGAEAFGTGSTSTHTLLIGQPHVALSPGKLTFSVEPVGTPSPSLSETVTNNGIVPLQIGQATIIANAVGADGDEFTITGDGCSNTTLAPGTSCQIGVRFNPKVSGTPQAGLRIPSNSPTSPDQAALDPPPGEATQAASPGAPAAAAVTAAKPKPTARCAIVRRGRGSLILRCKATPSYRVSASLARHKHLYATATKRTQSGAFTLTLRLVHGLARGRYTLAVTIGPGSSIRTVELPRIAAARR